MFIDLKLCLQPDALAQISARELAELVDGVALPQSRERARVVVEFACGQTDPLDHLPADGTGDRRAVVIVSPKLVKAGAAGVEASDDAQQLLETSWARRVVVGLIGVAERRCDDAVGLDAIVSSDDMKQGLFDAFRRVVQRLWFKVEPPRSTRSGFSRRPDLHLVRAADRETFRQCLALRHQVYSSLGYLDKDITDASIQLDFDCYDTRARQFAVIDRANDNRIAGTARLISPGLQPWQRPGVEIDGPQYERWCHEFAREEPGRVYRAILGKRIISSLPILDSFAYFGGLSDQDRYESLRYPQNSCEVSRVVVAPEYRGYSILHLLMERIVEEARLSRKNYLLLECAPFHEPMYGKLGFEVIKDKGRCYYTRAQRLDSWAVAMHLDLNEAHRIDTRDKGFRVNIEHSHQAPLELAISDPELDEQMIGQRMHAPYVPAADRNDVPVQAQKGTHGPLLAHLRLGLLDPGLSLCRVLDELHTRLPNAEVRLLSGSRELALDGPAERDERGCRTLINTINNWLEGLHVAV